MDAVLDLLSGPHLLLAFAVTIVAGFVKGAVGFAMPLVMISGMGLFLDPHLVVAGIVLPIVMSNGLQVMRAGRAAALAALREHALYVGIVCVAIFVSAQYLESIPPNVMFLVLGIPVVILSAVQLAGRQFRVPERRRLPFEVVVAVMAGVLGGLSGTWGPPTVLYLLALDTPKDRQMAVQGVVYGAGSVTLLAGHLQSGVLDGDTLPFSAILLIPALAGMWIGFWLGDRLDQEKFRRATLAVLILAGLNLVRRGLAG